jgi:ABC-2 type transport system permease protein
MSAPNHVLGGVEGALAMAGVTWKRLLRGKALWVVIAMAALPFVFTAARESPRVLDDWGDMIGFWTFLAAILAPVLLASAISEEIEERTMTYLWSRPLPRWSIVAGKLLAILPILWIVLAASLAAPYYGLFLDGGEHPAVFARTMAACVLGTMGVCAVTAGLATLVPRHATVVSLGYLVFVDRTLGFLDTSVAKLTVTYHSLRLSGAGEWAKAQSIGESIIWLIGLSAAWMAVAAWRIRRLE